VTRWSFLGSLKAACDKGSPGTTRLNQEETTNSTSTPATTAKCRIPVSREEERVDWEQRRS
jgi:hypothetical protein